MTGRSVASHPKDAVRWSQTTLSSSSDPQIQEL